MSLTLLQIVATMVVATILIILSIKLLRRKKNWESQLKAMRFNDKYSVKSYFVNRSQVWMTCAVGEIFKEVREGIMKMDSMDIPQKFEIIKFLTPKYGPLRAKEIAELGIRFADAVSAMRDTGNKITYSNHKSDALEIYSKLNLIYESNDYD